MMDTAKEENIRSLSNGRQYILYDWQGKCKWAFIENIYLVDPRFVAQFVAENEELEASAE